MKGKNMWKMAAMVVILGILATMLPLSALGRQTPAGTSENVTVKTGEEVNFPDPNLEALIRCAIDKPEGPIYVEDLERLSVLGAKASSIDDLTGLEYCTNLRSLDLGWCQISDLSPLSGLINLTRLHLLGNQISDLSPVSGLINLTDLGLGGNQISDLSPLSGLTNLTWLYLGGNQISDISPLSGLINLTGLHLWENQISDIKPLVDNTGLSNGDQVYLEDNPLSDTSIEVYIPQLKARGVIFVTKSGF